MSAPAWLEPLYDAAQMRAIDAWAIGERGVPSLELMERAGAARRARGRAARPARARSSSSIGKGNNGGDGLVAARLLRERGREVDVLAACDPAELAGDARANLERLPGEPPRRSTRAIAAERRRSSIDALLGTGATGEPRGDVADAIARDRRLRRARCSPSTCRAASTPRAARSRASPSRAAATVTFHAAKPGLWIEPGRGARRARARGRHRHPGRRPGRAPTPA